MNYICEFLCLKLKGLPRYVYIYIYIREFYMQTNDYLYLFIHVQTITHRLKKSSNFVNVHLIIFPLNKNHSCDDCVDILHCVFTRISIPSHDRTFTD